MQLAALPAAPSVDDEHETFRNELASVQRDGRRRWVYARQPAGRWYRRRTMVSVLLLAFLVLAPFVQVHGEPLMLLDVIGRRFVLLGVVFWPQDFYQVVLIALAALVTLVLVTASIGRVWCGWLCPQTIFMEMLFRRIEFLIEGSAQQQVRRDRAPWTLDKALRKGLKHGVFLLLSFGIANVFLAWIIGARALWIIVTDPPSRHLAGLIAIVLFSAVFYAVFARFREQACTLACPYGRMMSSLIDRRTVTVTYDRGRGEPRGKVAAGSRGSDAHGPAAVGHCVDCHQCVTVCPTGIDIRNGIQLECVNCTACIDACDDVMDRLSRPRGLIRLTSVEALESRTPWWSARVKAYAAVWLVLVLGVSAALASRRPIDVLVLRQPGTLFATLPNGEIANFYTVQSFNRTAQPVHFDLEVTQPAGAGATLLGAVGDVRPNALAEGRLLVHVSASQLHGGTTSIQFVVRSGGKVVQTIESSFVGPQ